MCNWITLPVYFLRDGFWVVCHVGTFLERCLLGAESVWSIFFPVSSRKLCYPYFRLVVLRSWENKPVATSLELELHFQARRADWSATWYLLSADFRLIQSNAFSPCICSLFSSVSACRALQWVGPRTQFDWKWIFGGRFAGLVCNCTSSLSRLLVQPWESQRQY